MQRFSCLVHRYGVGDVDTVQIINALTVYAAESQGIGMAEGGGWLNGQGGVPDAFSRWD